MLSPEAKEVIRYFFSLEENDPDSTSGRIITARCQLNGEDAIHWLFVSMFSVAPTPQLPTVANILCNYSEAVELGNSHIQAFR